MRSNKLPKALLLIQEGLRKGIIMEKLEYIMHRYHKTNKAKIIRKQRALNFIYLLIKIVVLGLVLFGLMWIPFII